MKNQSFFKRLGFAINGLALVFQTENSFRTQAFFAVIAFVLLAIISPPLIWWALLGFVVAIILAMEMFNTAIEQLCDLLHPDHHEKVKLIKDASAGGVLLASIASLWVGAMLILDYFKA